MSAYLCAHVCRKYQSFHGSSLCRVEKRVRTMMALLPHPAGEEQSHRL